MKLFLSYARKEREIADRIRLALEGNGHEVFFDRNRIPPGGLHHSVILRSFEQSDRMIFLISPRSVAPRAYAMTELSFAIDRWSHPLGFVLPVKVETTAPEQIPAYLKAVSIYEPQGDIAASVAYVVEKWLKDPGRVDIPRTITAVGDAFQAHEDRFRAADAPRRKEVADYFEKIGACLKAVYDGLMKNHVPPVRERARSPKAVKRQYA